MVKKLIVLLLIGKLSIGVGFAQKIDVSKIKLSWEVTGVSHDQPTKINAVLTITNDSDKTLPANGWKLYFNYGRTVSDATNIVNWEFINGDLNRIVPQNGFPALKSKESVKINYTASGKAINFRDAPSGFYLVWDNNDKVGVPLPEIQILPLNPKLKSNHVTPQQLFIQNKTIRDIAPDSLIKIFPSPVKYSELPGTFILNRNTIIESAPFCLKEADLFKADIALILGKPSANYKNKISLVKQAGIHKEGYELSVTAQQVTIKASTSTGMFYGIQSLKNLFTVKDFTGKAQEGIKIPLVEVSDYPRFGYRGFMLDVARNFHSKKEVFKILDLMGSYKLNVLHFHLNDDEGWRLQIPSLPELTEVGAKREHTLSNKKSLQPAYGSGPVGGTAPGSGFYSREDFIEILRYANKRHIKVIPEVETPGHARAAIKSMDSRYESLMAKGKRDEAEQYLLRDINDQSVYQSVQKWDDNVMNVALPSTYNFIAKVVDELILMYREAEAPLQTVHLGGDEVPAGVWEKSPAVSLLMENNPEIKSVDDVWYYYFKKVNNILKERGLYLSGWEEVALRKTLLEGKSRYIPNPQFVNDNFHAYVWNNVWGWGSEDLAYRLANAGYKTILAPATNFYFDMAYYEDFEELGTYWASYTDLDAPFRFVPFNYYKNAIDKTGKAVDQKVFQYRDRLTEFGKSNIVGLQALIWSETIRNHDQLEYMLAPKILGFAERAWAKDPLWATEQDSAKAELLYQNDWNTFVNRVGKRELPRLNTMAGGFNYRIPTVGATVNNGLVYANIQIPGLTIRYTTNGKTPDNSSKIYTQPFKKKGVIKFRAFNDKGRGGKTISLD